MVLLLELLDDHWDALKVREGKVSDLRRRMEELSAVGQVTAEEIGQLKEDLSREVEARLSWEEEVAQFRGSWKRRGRRCRRGTLSYNRKSLHC